MKVITYLKDAYELLSQSVVALGNFDGVHKGHQSIISKAVELASENNLISVVFTFQNHPLNFISGNTIVKNIENFDDKVIEIEKLGVDYLVALPFDKAVQKMSPGRFAKHILLQGLKCKIAVCGFNYSFGEYGSGKAEDLLALGKELGYETHIMPEYDIDGMLVSSTSLREFIEIGDFEKFYLFTGRPFFIKGSVIYGENLGNKLGFPTANINLIKDNILPPKGVYITNIYVNNACYRSVTNLGNKPTVGTFGLNLETHIIDFNQNIYGEIIKVEFIKKIRDEVTFDTIDELKLQISRDIEIARKYS